MWLYLYLMSTLRLTPIDSPLALAPTPQPPPPPSPTTSAAEVVVDHDAPTVSPPPTHVDTRRQRVTDLICELEYALFLEELPWLTADVLR